MNPLMTTGTQGDQVFFRVTALVAAEFNVV
jgi:hypothetical protein